ncbi:MAG: beta galactosidase jelly roll domain-containing protein [Calditrichia bacterium]|nr:beta galactosidase jelly roll domain-containing protein [Calditrichia bacterium]
MSILSIIFFFLISLNPVSSISLVVEEDERTESYSSRIMDLRGMWKFSIGDEENWKSPDFDDRSWEDIFVPSSWEDEGYPGYVGYAWYRKKIVLKSEHRNKYLYLNMGFIDDVDEVYVNGNFVGFGGSFPPNYFTAYHMERKYNVPEKYWNFNRENVIAVRVFNAELSGGILRGTIGIYELKYTIPLEVSLEGIWKFLPGDEPERKDVEFNDWDWYNVMVPAPWETQGFKNYDGFAWYRKSFIIPEKYRGEKLILLLGKIDDLDQTYLNGRLIGETGDMDGLSLYVDEEWLEYRGYRLTDSYINYGSGNLLAVRIYDGLVQGGIYQGPIGIVTEENYLKWQKRPKKKRNIFDFFLGD